MWDLYWKTELQVTVLEKINIESQLHFLSVVNRIDMQVTNSNRMKKFPVKSSSVSSLLKYRKHAFIASS